MKATVRARLTIGFLALVTIGSVASVAILAILSGTIDELKRVVTVSDTVEHKALEMRFDRDDTGHEPDSVPRCLDRRPAQLGPQHRQCRRKRMTPVCGGRTRPEEIDQMIAPVRISLLHGEIHQERHVLLHAEPNGIAVRCEQRRHAQGAEKELPVHQLVVGLNRESRAPASTDRQTCVDFATSARRS